MTMRVPGAAHVAITGNQNWQPIETAPRVTRVLVTTAERDGIVDIARQDHQGNDVWVWVTDDHESAATGYFDDDEPTHWMPLPKPPEQPK